MDETEKRSDIDHRTALDARDWIVRLASGHVTEADLQRFKAWRDFSPEHGRAFERERVFWGQLQVLGRDADGQPSAPSQRPGIRRRTLLIGGGAVVAAVAAGIAVPPLDLWWNADFSTAVGETADTTLPDGSVVSLNTDSAIAVDFRPDLRLVELLKGEAEFKVRPGLAPLFRVAALGGNSDALGTTFSVKAVDGVATVTVAEGHVRVAGPAKPTDLWEDQAGRIELAAEQQTTYARGAPPLSARSVDTGVAMAWRGGRVIFEGRPFASAVVELGRYVPERIVLAPGVKRGVPVSAIFSIKDALSAVEALAKTQGLVVRRIPGVMILIT